MGPNRSAAVLLLLFISCAAVIHSVYAHAGCGQHSPMGIQQQRLLRRHLQELRRQDSEANRRPRQLQQGTGSSKSSSGAGGSVGPNELRIGPVFQLSGIGGNEARRIEKQLVPAAIKVLQKYLQVIRPSGPPQVAKAFYADLQQGSCIIGKASPELAEVAKKSDLSLYITAEGTGCLPGMIAVATACEVDPATKRPILGTLNICPAALTGLDNLQFGTEAYGAATGRLVEVIVHEMIHVLGFGSNHYEDWRGPDGKLYGRKNVIVNKDGRPYMATPKVTKVARDFFGCSSLPGAPLENEGPSFSAVSHFEYRLLQREMMSPARPIDRSRARLSAFTLAALEDSGWYQANYDDAEPLDWGRGAGCDFVLLSCWDYMDKNANQPYFCGKGSVNQTRCTAAASGWGVCRSSAFTDSCLLVGKYSSDASAASSAREDIASSIADGRAAACYSPPQLEALQKAGSNGNLLPLLGGSFSARPGDICYNLISQPKPPSGANGSPNKPGCEIPEDCAPGVVKQSQAAKQAGAVKNEVTTESGPARNRNPLASLGSLDRTPAVFTFYEQDVKQGGVGGVSSSDSSDRTAACVSVAGGLPSGSEGSKPKRALLSTLAGAASGLVRFGHFSGISSSSRGAAPSRALLSAAVQSFSAVAQAPSSSTAAAAACTSSPVLCFRSSCDSQGQLFVEAQLPDSGTVKFACPSGKTVDLSKALPGRYLLGVLQCPSNQLVCESMGCGDCSLSGGVCSRGKCHCHMERFGPGCKGTLVPKL